jgi:hypothetical protein
MRLDRVFNEVRRRGLVAPPGLPCATPWARAGWYQVEHPQIGGMRSPDRRAAVPCQKVAVAEEILGNARSTRLASAETRSQGRGGAPRRFCRVRDSNVHYGSVRGRYGQYPHFTLEVARNASCLRTEGARAAGQPQEGARPAGWMPARQVEARRYPTSAAGSRVDLQHDQRVDDQPCCSLVG